MIYSSHILLKSYQKRWQKNCQRQTINWKESQTLIGSSLSYCSQLCYWTSTVVVFTLPLLLCSQSIPKSMTSLKATWAKLLINQVSSYCHASAPKACSKSTKSICEYWIVTLTPTKVTTNRVRRSLGFIFIEHNKIWDDLILKLGFMF